MFRSDSIDLRYYGFVIRRRKVVILLATSVCVALAIVLNLVMRPVYRATIRLEVNKEPSRSPLTGEALGTDDWRSDNVLLYTTAELITNHAVVREAVAALRSQGLLQMRPPRAEAAQRPNDRGRTSGGARSPSATEDEMGSPAAFNREVDWLLSILKVQPIRETRLVNIQVEHWDPRVAREIAQTVAHQFVEYQRRQRTAADTIRLGYLRRRIEEIKGQVDRERELTTSREVGVPVLESKLKQLSETIANFNDALVKARTERLTIGTQLARIPKELNEDVLELKELPVQSETLEGLNRDLLARETELAKAREVYKEKHPKLMVLESERQSIRANIRSELEKAVRALRGRYAMLEQRETSLSSAIAQAEADLRSVNNSLDQHVTRESELKTNRELYSLLLARVQDVQISSEVQNPLVHVIEPATVSPEPVRPRRSLNLVLGLVVGLLSGVGAALMLEHFRQAIRTPKDVTELLQLPVLGTIPKRP